MKMKSFRYVASALVGVSTLGITGPVMAQQTEMDLPADFHRYYGQRVNHWKDGERRIAKFDIDGDLNYDGVIDNFDAADQGLFEATPPGLIVGQGELTKIYIRLSPYRVDFKGEIVVSLELQGINRSDKSGRFASQEEENASTARVRVWRDAEKTELLLDSHDPSRRVAEFSTQFKEYPYNLPIAVPRLVYVEGVSSSPSYSGDVRLLGTVANRGVGTNSESKRSILRSFRTSFDHILLTVRPEPMAKEFRNDNSDGVWKSPPSSSK